MLSKNWITEKHIDFEYKKYVLLAYLKEVSGKFAHNQLYPSLAEIIEHYKHLSAIRENHQNILSSIPQRISGIDMENLLVSYHKILEDDALMTEIESIINYSLPCLEHYLNEGKKIYDFIEEHLCIQAVGLVPLCPDEGYMLLRGGEKADTRVYHYHITIYEQPDEKYRAIRMEYVKTYSRGFVNTYESIKTDMIRENKKLPNPATYAVETEMTIPLEETFLPLATRLLVKHVA